MVPTDIFEQTNVNVSEVQNEAKKAAWAISRMEDQVKMDQLNASTTTNLVAVGVTNLTIEKLLEAKYMMDANNVPMEGRFWLGHANQQQALLKETEITSSDYNSIKALVRGEVDTFLGFKFIWVGNMLEGGLYKTGNNRTNFAWHMDAMCAAYKINPTVSTDWLTTIQSNVVVPKVVLGAHEALPEGIVKIVCDETA